MNKLSNHQTEVRLYQKITLQKLFKFMNKFFIYSDFKDLFLLYFTIRVYLF